MANYTPEDAQYAERIVNGLLNEQGELPPIEGALVVADVEADAAEFRSDLDLLEMIGADCPATRVQEELVPVALSLLIGSSWPWFPGNRPFARRWRYHPFAYEWLHEMLRFTSKEDLFSSDLQTMPREQARAAFSRGVVAFLATRIAALRDEQPATGRWFGGTFLSLPRRVGGPRVSTPGCNFAISTNSSGLRVFWSGAYRVSANYFSHPTTPAVGVLQSGTYVFGIDGGAYGSTVQWDTNAVTTLPGSPHVHLNF
jgi:hypothetical protein